MNNATHCSEFQPASNNSNAWAEPRFHTILSPHEARNHKIALHGLSAIIEVLARNDLASEANKDGNGGAYVTLDKSIQTGLFSAAKTLCSLIQVNFDESTSNPAHQQSANATRHLLKTLANEAEATP